MPSRRRLLRVSGAVVSASLAGCSASALPPSDDSSRPAYVDGTDVVSDHDQVTLSVAPDTVHVGEDVVFDIRNQSPSDVTLGCHNPWALQQHTDDGWAHRTWTADGYYDLCARILPTGERTTIEFTLAAGALPERATALEDALQPGRYRFLLLGLTPYLGVEFTVTDTAD